MEEDEKAAAKFKGALAKQQKRRADIGAEMDGERKERNRAGMLWARTTMHHVDYCDRKRDRKRDAGVADA